MTRPKVIVLNSATLNGRLAVSPERLLLYGDERWQAIDPGGDWDPLAYLLSLHRPGATLEGSGSFMREGDPITPLPPCEGDPAPLYEDYLPAQIVERPGHRGWFIAVDGRGRVRWQVKEGDVFGEAYAGWYAMTLVGYHTPPAYLAYLRQEQIPYLVAGQGQVDLEAALIKLRERLGVECVLSTAGGKLNGALLRAGLVDEINVILVPAVVGGGQTPALFDGPAFGPEEQPVRLALLSAQVEAEGRVWLRYRVARSEEGA